MQTIAGAWTTKAGQASDSTTARIQPIQFNFGITGANGMPSSTGLLYPAKEPLTITLSLENVGDLQHGKSTTLSLQPFAVPLEVAALDEDGSVGSAVWLGDVTGAPTTLQPYEIARTKLTWNGTDCHGNTILAGNYALQIGSPSGAGVPISGAADGAPFSISPGADPSQEDFGIQ